MTGQNTTLCTQYNYSYFTHTCSPIPLLFPVRCYQYFFIATYLNFFLEFVSGFIGCIKLEMLACFIHLACHGVFF